MRTKPLLWKVILLEIFLGISVVSVITTNVVYAQPVAQGIQIPIVINIYNNANISVTQATDAVEKASKILQQAGLKLTRVKVNATASDGDTGNDGDITPAEDQGMIDAAKRELGKTPNKKGIKISFVRTPEVGSKTPGWSYRCQPLVVVKNRGNASLTGETIAHEISHILCLGPGHKIDATTTADSGGHAPDKPGKSGKENLMAPSGYPNCTSIRTGTHLTPDQINKMLTKWLKVGKCAIQWKAAYPAEKEKQQYGTKTDNILDHGTGPPHRDLFSTTLYSIDGTSNIEGRLSLSALFSGTVDITYALVFDSDNNAGTGYSYGGFNGIEFALELTVTGSGGMYSIGGVIRDLSTGSTRTLPGTPEILSSVKFVDLAEGGGTPILDDMVFTLPKQYVGIDTTLTPMSATEIPIGVLAQESSIIYDSDQFIFNLNQWLDDPTLETFGTGVPTPGANYPFKISGLKPNSLFDFYVDDRLVLSDMLDASGGFSGNFVFPSDLPNTEMHFLTAQDSTGEFAYSITCPKTPPPQPTPCVGGSMVLIGGPEPDLSPPYIGLASTIIIATVTTAIYLKHTNRRKSKR